MKPENLLLALGAFIVAVFAISTLAQCADCDQRGGVLVRGAFWYECVEPRK